MTHMTHCLYKYHITLVKGCLYFVIFKRLSAELERTSSEIDRMGRRINEAQNNKYDSYYMTHR